MSAMLGVADLFKRAIYYGFETADERHRIAGVDGQDIYISYARIGGANYAVRIKLDVVTFDKHLRYKTHQVFKVDEIELIDLDMKKEDGETRTASDGKNSKIEPVDNTTSSIKKISELVKIVKEYGEKDEQQKLNVPENENGEPQHSLTLDENGEPLVAYHGAKFSDIEEFDTDMIFLAKNKAVASGYAGSDKEATKKEEPIDTRIYKREIDKGFRGVQF